MILWLLQDVGKTQMLKDNFDTVKLLNFNFANIGVTASSTVIPGLYEAIHSPAEGFIVRGGVKLIELINSASNLTDILGFDVDENSFDLLNKLKKGVFYSLDNFDQFYYSTLGLPLLNQDAFYLDAQTHLDTKFDTDYFIKPSKDLKSLIPGIIKAGVSLREFILNSEHRASIFKEQLLLAPLQKIRAEYRFFVVDRKIITYSQYKTETAVKYSAFAPNEVLAAADAYAQLYQPHDIFTMDLAVMQDSSIKIVEYNCWNGSGLYHCDKLKLFKAVQDYVKLRP